MGCRLVVFWKYEIRRTKYDGAGEFARAANCGLLVAQGRRIWEDGRMVMAGQVDRLAVRAMRRFAVDYQRKHCPVGTTVDPEKKLNEKWRRISGITADIEACMDGKERRAGIRALIRWIEKFVRADLVAATAAAERIRAGVGEYLECGDGGGTSLGTGLRTDADPWHSRCEDETGEACGEGASLGTGLRTAAGPWHPGCGSGEEGGEDDVDRDGVVWACEGRSVELVVRVCGELNLTRSKLTGLIQEVRGISATELIDGFRLGAVKRLLAERVRFLAEELWLKPGLYAGVRVMDEGLLLSGGGASGYFAVPDAGWRRTELGDERKKRLERLIGAYDAGWKRGGLDREGFAAALGFRNFNELNRACLNVLGKTARQVAYAICRDVVEYYLAREMEALRELAAAEPASAVGARARWLYSGTGERAGAGVCLMWATQDPAWLGKMGGWLERG